MSEDDDRTTGPVEPGGPRPTWGKVALREDERRFLEGPQRRFADLRRATRISAEFVKGFRALRALAPCVTVFGSARFTEGHPYYALARRIGAEIAKLRLTAMTGGGPGSGRPSTAARARRAGARSGATSSCRANRCRTPTSTAGWSSATPSCAR